MTNADYVIAGAGHNSLITAAYLARAGYSCVVLDARPIPGGGASTEDLLMPGLGIDTCSTGHTLIRVNPLIRADELGLVSKHGLSYVDPDPVAHVCFPDGEHFTMSLDPSRTIAEFARFSERDAATYSRMLDEWADVNHIFGQDRFRPIGYGPATAELLDAHPRSSIWRRRGAMSAYDLIMTEFEDRHSQAFMLWMTFQTIVALDRAGTGLLAYSLIAARQKNSWSIPLGGSGTLIDALVGYLADRDVDIHCDQTVEQLIIEDGRCVGVQTSSGERFTASKGVVSTIHIKHLVDMAPPEMWGDDFLFGVDTYEVGISGYAAYLAATEAPIFDTPGGGVSAVSAGLVGWPEQFLRMLRNVNDGVQFDDVPFLLVATPTLVDNVRTVDELHTVKLLSAVTFELRQGETWEERKEVLADRFFDEVGKVCSNFTADKVVDRAVRSPEDLETHNSHMIRGAFHGGDRSPANSGANRPVPGWAQHRMPIPGLYQTGGTTHPGGSITGAPGRNAAVIILEDQGHDPTEMLGK
ncbi:MAG: phytoene desaturase family protein [Acidimicrobiales bacterium]